MALQLRGLADFTEDPGSVSSTYIRCLSITCNLNPVAPSSLCRSLYTRKLNVYIQAYTYTKKTNLSFTVNPSRNYGGSF